MARVTVEDCINVIPNRYELVLLAAQRARDISAGAEMTVDRDNDKNAVVALREIAEQTIDFNDLRRHISRGVNRHQDLTLEDDELMNIAQSEFAAITNASNDQAIASAEISEIDFEEELGAAISAAGAEDELAEAEAEDDEDFAEPSLDDLAEAESEVMADSDSDDTELNV